MAVTLTTDLLQPEVWAGVIQGAWFDRLIMRNFANVDTRLVGQPGSVINFPEFDTLSDADDLTENVAQTTEKLTQSYETATVKEVGQGFSVTDQADMYAMGQILAEGRRQLPITIARKVDTDLAAALVNENDAAGVAPGGGGFDQTTAIEVVGDGSDGGFNLDLLSDGLAAYGDEYLPEDIRAMVVTSATANQMRKLDILQQETDVVVTGQIGRVFGVPVVLSNRGLTNGKTLLVAEAPLLLVMKAMPEVELEREASFRRSNVYTRVHYGVFFPVRNKKLVKVVHHG